MKAFVAIFLSVLAMAALSSPARAISLTLTDPVASPIFVPRDAATFVTLTFHCTDSQGAALTRTKVSFSANPKIVALTQHSAVSDYFGNVTVKVSSAAINRGDIAAKVTASVGADSTSADMVLSGLKIEATTDQKSIVFEALREGDRADDIHVKVTDNHGDPAQGAIDFGDSARGRFETVLDGTLTSGAARATLFTGLTPRSANVDDTVTAVIRGSASRVSAWCHIKFVYPVKFTALVDYPNPSTAWVHWHLLDSAGDDVPGAEVMLNFMQPDGTKHSSRNWSGTGTAQLDTSSVISKSGHGTVTCIAVEETAVTTTFPFEITKVLPANEIPPAYRGPDYKAVVSCPSVVYAASSTGVPVLVHVVQMGQEPVPETVTVRSQVGELVYGGQRGDSVVIPAIFGTVRMQLNINSALSQSHDEEIYVTDTGSIGSFLSATATVHVIGSYLTFTVVSQPAEIPADGKSQPAITLRVTDAAGNPAPHAPCLIYVTNYNALPYQNVLPVESDAYGLITYTVPAAKVAGRGELQVVAQSGNSNQVFWKYVTLPAVAAASP